MKIKVLFIFSLLIGCSCTEKSNTVSDKKRDKYDLSSKSGLTVSDSLSKHLSDTTLTITVSYAAIECGCPQWFETKFKSVKFLDGVERFYLEPISKNLFNANDLWDGRNLSLMVKITGRFSKEKEVPVTYYTKGVPEKARIFWYEQITVVSPPSKP